MDWRLDRIRSSFEGCLQQAGIFDRVVEGGHLFEADIVTRSNEKWLVLAAGLSEGESAEFFCDQHSVERAIVPIRISPEGELRFLLFIRPFDGGTTFLHGRYLTDFSKEIPAVEMHQGCYVRADNLQRPNIEQIRWELDAVTGHRVPRESWLKPWHALIGCNPAHAPSHWHINSPPLEVPGRRKKVKTTLPPELRLAIGLPNPLLLMLSLANWLRE